MPDTYHYSAENEAALDTGALLQEIVRCLVDEPASVAVDETMTDSDARFEVTVAADDIGKVAGKEGRTIDLLTRLLGRIEGRNRREVLIRIVRPKNGGAR